MGAGSDQCRCTAKTAAAAAAPATHSLQMSPFGPRISVSGRSIVTVVVVTIPAFARLAAFSRGAMDLCCGTPHQAPPSTTFPQLNVTIKACFGDWGTVAQ